MYGCFKDGDPAMSQPSFIDNFSQQFSLEPSRTALLVIDMQNATGNRNMGLGKLLAVSYTHLTLPTIRSV